MISPTKIEIVLQEIAIVLQMQNITSQLFMTLGLLLEKMDQAIRFDYHQQNQKQAAGQIIQQDSSLILKQSQKVWKQKQNYQSINVDCVTKDQEKSGNVRQQIATLESRLDIKRIHQKLFKLHQILKQILNPEQIPQIHQFEGQISIQSHLFSDATSNQQDLIKMIKSFKKYSNLPCKELKDSNCSCKTPTKLKISQNNSSIRSLLTEKIKQAEIEQIESMNFLRQVRINNNSLIRVKEKEQQRRKGRNKLQEYVEDVRISFSGVQIFDENTTPKHTKAQSLSSIAGQMSLGSRKNEKGRKLDSIGCGKCQIY